MTEKLTWQVEWGSYIGRVNVVVADNSCSKGEAIDHHTEADNPAMLVRLDDSGEEKWFHPRYVWPLRWE